MSLVEQLNAAPHSPDLPFPHAEYERRLSAVRSRMEQAEIDVLVVSNTSNIGYLTGYDTTMPSAYTVLIVPRHTEPTLHCSELEAASMLYTGRLRAIEVFDWHDAQDTGTDLARILIDVGYAESAIGLEMGYPEVNAIGAFDTKSFLTLQERLPKARFLDATLLVLEERLVKSAQEIEYMRQAGCYTWEGLKAGLAAVREGVTDNDVIAAVYHGLITAGSEIMSIDPMIMSGARTGWMPHIPFRRDSLERGDPVYLEVTGTHCRYNAPSMRSAVLGHPTDDIRRLTDACIGTLGLLLENIKPGRTGHEVARIAAQGFADVPDSYFHGVFGYGIGMGFKPSWTENPMYIAEGIDRPLEPGMTFHLPVCIWIPRGFGVGFSESVVVTQKGCECLTPNKELHLMVVEPPADVASNDPVR